VSGQLLTILTAGLFHESATTVSRDCKCKYEVFRWYPSVFCTSVIAFRLERKRKSRPVYTLFITMVYSQELVIIHEFFRRSKQLEKLHGAISLIGYTLSPSCKCQTPSKRRTNGRTDGQRHISLSVCPWCLSGASILWGTKRDAS